MYDLTIKQAAKILGCAPANVLKLIKRGVLEASKEIDPKAGSYSGNMRYVILRSSVEKRIAETRTRSCPN